MMLRIAAIVLVAVELGGGFGDAEATVVSTTDESMLVDLHVEVTISADAVLAHLALPGEPTQTLPLIERESGVYGITTELKKANYQVVFEIIGPTSTQSEVVTLGALGAEINGEPPGATTVVSDVSAETNEWVWLAAAFAAASLSALAFWVLGGRDGDEDDPDQASEDLEDSDESESSDDPESAEDSADDS